MRSFILTIVLIAVSSTALADGVYDDELADASSKLRALMARAEGIQLDDDAGKLAIYQSLASLSVKLHRVSEEAGQSDIEIRRTGGNPSGKLLLVVSVCEELDLADQLTGNYLDTGDKIFWKYALQAAKSANEFFRHMK